ncbi:MAG: hypothetical protein DMG06_08920 [Acidobacteria bacterium]|nr:MAG: hypothetical protein DMG06_08920 [Acidobacteriota bacterium]
MVERESWIGLTPLREALENLTARRLLECVAVAENIPARGLVGGDGVVIQNGPKLWNAPPDCYPIGDCMLNVGPGFILLLLESSQLGHPGACTVVEAIPYTSLQSVVLQGT